VSRFQLGFILSNNFRRESNAGNNGTTQLKRLVSGKNDPFQAFSQS
jgi:hypothetical protein